MSENYIVINGKKADLTPEQLEALGIKVEKKPPFSRAEAGDNYYFIAPHSVVCRDLEVNRERDNSCFEVANYCTDKDLLQQQAYRETLNRLLWRFSMEHDGDKIDWNNHSMSKYFVAFAHDTKCWVIDDSFRMTQLVGVVPFLKKEVARQAINEIVIPFMKAHPDFKL